MFDRRSLMIIAMPTLAFAHGEGVRGSNGGVIGDVGDRHVEMLARDGEIRLWVLDANDRPVSTAGTSGNLIILIQGRQQTIRLEPGEEDAFLVARGDFRAAPGMRVVASLSRPGQPPRQGRFTPADCTMDNPERRVLDPEAHILLVEDDGEMRQLVSRLMREAGLRVSTARDGREMWEVMDHPAGAPNLILLDVMLPGASGLDLLRRLRERHRTPVIMLTARGEEMDRVLGLELGADDYVAKPFAPRELVARVRALLRRAAPAADPATDLRSRRVSFAGWQLDTARRELVSPDAVVVDLSGAEYDLLMAFLEHPHRVLSREQLLEVGKRRVAVDAFDRSIDVQVSRLRRKIEPEEDSPQLIKTVRGAGYLFTADVSRA